MDIQNDDTEIRDISIELRGPPELKRPILEIQKKKEVIKEIDPIKMTPIKRNFIYVYISIVFILMFLLILTNMFWFNKTFSNKSFNTNVTVENENIINTPEMPIQINNSFRPEYTIVTHINNTVVMPDNIQVNMNNNS